ncbi:MAG: cell division protein FtsX [Chitinophagales bacterium]|jgi:cell division transport system permease protein|nr:permease-like cell division protein FtsX [Sphingobacteriales bacterium]
METQSKPARNKISYWNSVFSITTVLFLTGFLGIFIWIAKNTSDALKESVYIQVEMVDTTQSTYDNFKAELENLNGVKQVKFVSKDIAAAKLKKEINDDFINVIGYNPLFNSFEVNIKSEKFNPEVLESTKNTILKSSLVKDATYPKVISKTLNKNLRKITLILGAITLFLLIIAVVLIDSTIRLAMFSDRFLIKSMQLVGATRWFIIRPYIWRGILNGILSALIASGLLVLILYLFDKYTQLLELQKEIKYLSIIFFGLILLGVILSFISTFFAVNKYLRMKLDSLY